MGASSGGVADLKKKKSVRSLLGAQRQILIKVNKAYRTAPGEACCVIAGVIPIDLMIKERIVICNDVAEGVPRHISRDVRRRETLVAWQNRWDAADTGRETYQYLPSIVERIKMKVNWDHYVTQCLTGHGNFRWKLHGFTLQEDPWCLECGQGVEDTAWHTLAICPSYTNEREEMTPILTGNEMEDKRNLVTPENYPIFFRTARRVLKKKETRGRD